MGLGSGGGRRQEEVYKNYPVGFAGLRSDFGCRSSHRYTFLGGVEAKKTNPPPYREGGLSASISLRTGMIPGTSNL
jgi:hypothetical protein